MERFIFIRGDLYNPEGVKMALAKACPNHDGIDKYDYSYEQCLYYPDNGEISGTTDDSFTGRLLAAHGEELQPVPKKNIDIKRLMQQEADKAMEACKSIKKLCRQI